MNIVEATKEYEAWLKSHVQVVAPDLRIKHRKMHDSVLSFFRATFYRWAQLWLKVCPELSAAPQVIAIADLHLDNFGTWRDAEGRLVWGVNDFDECFPLAYTNDLVRLMTSIQLAIEENQLAIHPNRAAQALLSGYSEGLNDGGRPIVLADKPTPLREMMRFRLRDPDKFWQRLERQAEAMKLSKLANRTLKAALPKRATPYRIIHRVAGLGSLGRERWVALAEWNGAKIAREIKARAPSACIWARARQPGSQKFAQKILERGVRAVDPFLVITRDWIIRRLSPDCARVELAELPNARDERDLLFAMGFETANLHLGSPNTQELLNDLKHQEANWLLKASATMARAVRQDWKDWRRATRTRLAKND